MMSCVASTVTYYSAMSDYTKYQTTSLMTCFEDAALDEYITVQYCTVLNSHNQQIKGELDTV